jgi:lipopolysaccharide assembly outer membrane protein LptD (OstA)
LSQSLRYNFVATTRKLSNLSTTLRSSAIPNVKFDLIATHDFYDPETNEIKNRLPRLVYFSLNTDIDLRVKGFYSAPTSADTSQIPSSKTTTGGLLLDISHRYSETRTSSGIAKTHWASLSTGIALTPNWNLSYVCRYDFEQKKITEQSFDLYRDLHCWEARFSWVLQGYRSGYYFKINIKSLPQVKIEKSPGGLREVFF